MIEFNKLCVSDSYLGVHMDYLYSKKSLWSRSRISVRAAWFRVFALFDLDIVRVQARSTYFSITVLMIDFYQQQTAWSSMWSYTLGDINWLSHKFSKTDMWVCHHCLHLCQWSRYIQWAKKSRIYSDFLRSDFCQYSLLGYKKTIMKFFWPFLMLSATIITTAILFTLLSLRCDIRQS